MGLANASQAERSANNKPIPDGIVTCPFKRLRLYQAYMDYTIAFALANGARNKSLDDDSQPGRGFAYFRGVTTTLNKIAYPNGVR